jgi:hypothetical protein
MPVKHKQKHINKARKNYMISVKSIELLEKLKKDSFPELSYSQIVDCSISDLARRLHIC